MVRPKDLSLSTSGYGSSGLQRPARDKKFSSADLDSFGTCRWWIYRGVVSLPWEILVSVVICLNFVVIIMEANYGAECNGDMISGCVPGWLVIVNYCFVGFYSLEAFATIFVYRSRVLRDHWTLFDLCIVLMAWVDMLVSAIVTTAGMQEVQLLRLFRIARLARAARIVHMSPELRAMMNGVISALTTVFWGLIMVMLLLAVWAVLAVELLHDTAQEVHADKDLCLQAFDSVFMVMLMFFQTLMAGDSWGDCAVPMIQKNPLSIIIFGGSLLTVQLGFANLVLAVIVERARQAHEEEQRQNVVEQLKKRREAENRLLEMCQAIDVDNNGILTLDELIDAYATNEEFRKTLMLLEIDETDLICLFDLMDVDRSGDLTYEELVNCIHKSETNDLKRQMMLVKLQVQDIWLRIRDTLESQQETILSQVTREARKPSLLDAKTYLIRKLTSNSTFSKKTSNVSSFKKHVNLQDMASIQEGPQQDAGTELSPPVFAMRQLRNEIKDELEYQLSKVQEFVDTEVSKLIQYHYPAAAADPLDLNGWSNAQNQWGVDVEDVSQGNDPSHPSSPATPTRRSRLGSGGSGAPRTESPPTKTLQKIAEKSEASESAAKTETAPLRSSMAGTQSDSPRMKPRKVSLVSRDGQ